MNKQLINKYKPEFDHWLNDGFVLMGKRDHFNNSIKWYPSVTNPFTEVSDLIVIIINDEYMELRKALTEGKTIEYLGQSSNVWHEVPEPDFNLHPTCYRIKPDEPKFKVGDFVKFTDISNKHPQQIIKIEDEIVYTEFNKCLLTQLILWTPVKGEWCWFYDNPDSRHSHLAQFYDIHKSSASSISTFMSSKGLAWNFCEPFLNSLPSYLKDK